jgi:predicted RecA/RadA family phage recombinase
MAKNFIQPGENLTLIAPSGGVVSGTGYLIGTLFVVAQVSAAAAATFAASTCGVWELPKASGAWTAGAKVYWDDTAKNVTTTATSNTLIGCATIAQVSGATTGYVRLNGTV